VRAPRKPDKPSLRALVIKGSVWTLTGHGGVLLIRLVRSLVMTRLLFPEVYGLMTLVWAVLTGLQMLADTGIQTTIIRDPRGDDPHFLNTAFTANVFRGLLLWLVSCLLAYPLAAFYHQPILARLLPVTGLTALIHGFTTTAMFTRRRHMDFRRLALLDLATETVTFIVLVIWAYFSPDVWCLVGGAVAGQLFLVLAGHLYLPGIRNHFHWDRSALDTFVGFGKWIYLSSTVYFFSTQSDRFVLGHYLDMGMLGVYGTATVLSSAVQAVVIRINSDVLFPAYSRVVPEGVARLRQVMLRARQAMDLCLVLPIAVMMILGTRIVSLLYDQRYHQAGWMLQILSVRLLIVASISNSESSLVALGHPKYSFAQNLCRAVAICVGIPIGWSLAGVEGVIWAVALAELPPLIVMWTGLARYRLFSPAAELRSLAAIAAGILVGFGILQFWH
jgi:O-antigen/teichoic acid export membrane protein